MKNGYVTINHPHRIGDRAQVIPTGKTRTENGGRTEAEGRVISPKANLETIWIRREDILKE